MSKRTVSSAVISFDDGSFVRWQYVGKVQRLYRAENRWKIYVRVEQRPSIEQIFESWDKPSIHTANHYIKNAIKDFKSIK